MDGGVASEENNSRENHPTDEDVQIIIFEKSDGMNNKEQTTPALSLGNSGGL
jgi:hypothetical protein